MADFLEDFSRPEERAVLKVACENSLKAYIKVMHYYNTGAHFEFMPFHNEVIQKLEDLAFYKSTKNLLLNLPVGFGKSAIVEYFKSWCFARNKNICFLYTSYSDKLIQKLSSEIIEIIYSEPFQAMWNYTLKKDKKSRASWSIEGAVGRAGLTAGSIGGTITGLDAGNPAVPGFCGALIIDDPMKAGDEIYETKRETVVEYFNRKLKTRLRRSDVPIILIMQRLHEEDLTGYIKHEGKYTEGLSEEELTDWQDDWEVVTVQALVDEKSIWEKKVSTKTLIKERNESPWTFYPQRQQEPNSSYNTEFKGLRFVEDSTLIYNGFAFVDKSFGGEDSTTYAAGKIVKIDGEDRIVMFGKKFPSGRHVDTCIKEIEAFNLKYFVKTTSTENNDDKGFTAKNNGWHTYHETMNKHYKIMTYLYTNWKNIYFLPETDGDFIRQIQSYNENASHDDSPDVAASLVRKLKSKAGIHSYTDLAI